MGLFFGQETQCDFGADPICKKLGSVTIHTNEYAQESQRWPYGMILVVFIIAGLVEYFAN